MLYLIQQSMYKQVDQVSERSDKENLCEAKKIRF